MALRPTLRELESSLEREWSEETLLVYADELQSVGDPLGELIALEMRHRNGSVNGEIPTPGEFRAQKAGELLQGAHPFRETLRLEWKDGLIQSATLMGRDGAALSKQIRQLLQVRAARFLRTLIVAPEGIERPAVRDVLRAVLQAEPHPPLKWLLVGCGVEPAESYQRSGFYGITSETNLLPRQYPRLHVVAVPGGFVDLPWPGKTVNAWKSVRAPKREARIRDLKALTGDTREILGRALFDPTPEVRLAAMEAAVRLDAQELAGTLVLAARLSPVPQFVKDAQQGQADGWKAEIVDDPFQALGLCAALACLKERDEAARAAVEALAKHPHRVVRAVASGIAIEPPSTW